MTALPKIPRPITILAALAVLSAASAQSNTATTFTDKRDGKTYRTAVIGKQRWMAENLNFKTERSVCYENKESNCKKYGRLYNWEDAMTACPAGWRLPSEQEWDSLALAVGGKRVAYDEGGYYWEYAGKKFKSKTGWNDCIDGISGNGTDEFGFSAMPGGYGNYPGIMYGDSDVSFNSVGNGGYWWSAKEFYPFGPMYASEYAKYRYMACGSNGVLREGHYKSNLYSVRCVKDIAK